MYTLKKNLKRIKGFRYSGKSWRKPERTVDRALMSSYPILKKGNTISIYVHP